MKIFRQTNAYKIAENEKRGGRLSHAYLLVYRDAAFLRAALAEFAKLILCDDPDADTRISRLIDREEYSDCLFFPEKGKNIAVADIRAVIDESILRPTEGDRKLFVFCDENGFAPAAQNKLLKLAEDPPTGVYLLVGTTNEYQILPTVKSRLKRLEIPAFSKEQILEYVEENYPLVKAKEGIAAMADGQLSAADRAANNPLFGDLVREVITVLKNLDEGQVPVLCARAEKYPFAEYFAMLRTVFREVLRRQSGGAPLVSDLSVSIGKLAAALPRGAVAECLDELAAAEKKLRFNAADGQLLQYLLFKFTEAKQKWQRS